MNNTFDFSEFSRQSPKGIVVNYFIILYKSLKSSWVLIPILLTKDTSELNLTKIGLAVLAILIYILIRAVLVYLNFKFKIKDNAFILKQGILNKSNISVPFEKIQHINFKQNFIQQIINVTQVEIETAGAKTVEISIKALSREKAEALKQALFSKMQEVTAIENNEPSKEILHKVSVKDLLKISISENHFKSLALLFAFIFSGYVQVKDFLETLELDQKFDAVLEENANSLLGDLFLMLFLLVFSFIISVVISFVTTFIRHFNLQVSIENNRLEINQGLFTKQNNILKKQKVQSIEVSTNPIQQKLGIYNVIFKQAVSGKINYKKIIKVVGFNQAHIEILKNILFLNTDFNNQEKQKPDVYYKTQLFFRYFLLLLLLNGIFGLISNSLFLVNLLLIPFFVVLVLLKYKKCYYSFNNDMLLVGSGQIATKTTYFEHFKLQNIKMKQTVFQKRKGVVNLVLQTASGKIVLPCIKTSKAIEMYNFMLYKSETSVEKWM
ncbi:PH domain-containing protein [Lutibacter sp. A64]|uniref:PH domain-containing protein n=1 Tax=Lutibacter sp. A64 TaxID=2918526 RepID=UPI001F053636|nr:PH domain-containing protein [Lutibacter sp. A64]UMB53871.1 PH domain-containing protein [Lutibacter sp. A64]